MLKVILFSFVLTTILLGSVIAMQHCEMKAYDIYTTGF